MKMTYFDEAAKYGPDEMGELGISNPQKMAVINYNPMTEGEKLIAIEEELSRAGYYFDGAESTEICLVKSEEDYKELKKLYDKLVRRKW